MLHPREIAYCSVFGAAALFLPVIFHLFHLGSFFMPMYLPLVALAFFVRPLPAALTSLLLPILSGAITGMPPFYPPVAFIMSIELSIMGALIAFFHRKFSTVNCLFILIPILILGRFIGVGCIYFMSLFMKLPAKYIAGASLLSGWPGIILMIIVIPALLRISRTFGHMPFEGNR